MHRHISTKPVHRWNPVFALAIGVIALMVHVFGGICLQAAAGETSPLPDGALARLGTLRWRHGDLISYVAFLPDGKSVVSADRDNAVRLWDRETGNELRRFVIPQAAAMRPIRPGIRLVVNGRAQGQSGIAVSCDGKTFAGLILDNLIQLWDTRSGKELRRLKAPPTGVTALLFSPDGKTLAARSGDSQIYLLDPVLVKEIRPLKAQQAGDQNRFLGNNAAVMAFAPDGKTLATAETVRGNGRETTYVKLVSVDSGADVCEIEAAQQGVSAVAFSPNAKYLAYACVNAIHLCNPDTGRDIRRLNVPAGATGLVFSPDSKTLAAKGRDQLIRLFETDSAKEISQFGMAIDTLGLGFNQTFTLGVPADLHDMAFSPDGKVLAMGGGHALRFWDVSSAKEILMSGGHRGPVTALALTPDGKTVVSRGADNVICRWDAATGKELGHFQAPSGSTSAALSTDARTIALRNIDTSIRVHDLASSKEMHRFKGHVNGTATLAFSQDGKLLAARGSYDQTIRLFDTVKGLDFRQISLQGNNPAGTGGIVIWETYPVRAGLTVAFSPDGQTLAANVLVQMLPPGMRDLLSLRDVTTGKEIRQIPWPKSTSVVNIAFAPDGRVIALENVNQAIHLLEIASGRERGQLGKPVNVAAADNFSEVGVGAFSGFNRPAALNTFAFSPDGETLAAKGSDHSIRIWDVAALKEIGQFTGHDGAIASLAFAQDGKTLATGSNDTTILLWDMTRVNRSPKPQAIELESKQVASLWTDLRGDDAAKAYRSILTLTTAPKQAVSFLQQQLKPAAPADVKKIDRWILDLDSGNFKIRTIAAAELEKQGELVVPALKKVLAAPSSVETRRRVEPLLEKLTSGSLTTEQVQVARAVEVLEKLNSAEARQVLETLSKGAPGAFPTREAQASLDRLARRSVASRP